MQDDQEQLERKCYGCQRPLADGVRFCVACGTHNFDPDAGRLAVAQRKMRVHRFGAMMDTFTHWWRYLVGGIRR